jgi:hypothetical protein
MKGSPFDEQRNVWLEAGKGRLSMWSGTLRAVRYALNAPGEEMVHCHCSMCRKAQGGYASLGLMVRRDAFILEQGAGNLTVYESSPGSRRSFCSTCGSPIDHDYQSEPDHVWIAPGTIDGGAHPGHPRDREMHIFVGSKVPWHPITDELPQYETEP